jgi:hypothetical protein
MYRNKSKCKEEAQNLLIISRTTGYTSQLTSRQRAAGPSMNHVTPSYNFFSFPTQAISNNYLAVKSTIRSVAKHISLCHFLTIEAINRSNIQTKPRPKVNLLQQLNLLQSWVVNQIARSGCSAWFSHVGPACRSVRQGWAGRLGRVACLGAARGCVGLCGSCVLAGGGCLGFLAFLFARFLWRRWVLQRRRSRVWFSPAAVAVVGVAAMCCRRAGVGFLRFLFLSVCGLSFYFVLSIFPLRFF